MPDSVEVTLRTRPLTQAISPSFSRACWNGTQLPAKALVASRRIAARCLGMSRRVSRLPCGLHLERIVEPVEIVEQPDRGSKFNYLTFVEVSLEISPEFFVNIVGVERDTLGEAQRDLFFFGEIGAVLEIAGVLDLFAGVAVALCQSAV